MRITAVIIALVMLCSPCYALTDIEKLKDEARKGNPHAQLTLGDMYEYGVVVMPDGSRVEKNKDEAVSLFTQASKKLLEAKYLLGNHFYDNDTRDDRKSAKWFTDWLDGIYREKSTFETDMEKELVGSVHYKLGMLYYQECRSYLLSLFCGSNQTSVPKSYQLAAKHFQKAAELGDKEAIFELATMYELGRGLLQDYVEAAKLYEEAYKSGNKEAAGSLAELYMHSGDQIKAHMWFNIGASENLIRADEKRDKLAETMTPAQINDAQKLARDYLLNFKKP